MEDNAQISVDGVNSSQNDVDLRNQRRVASKKTNKPLIEKRRRARINECLQQLKEIIVRDRQLDNVRGNRLEKADILEMTVEYIRQLSHEGSPVSCLQSAYERGVERCVREMSEFMHSQRGVIDSSVTHKLTSHCRKMLGHQYSQADNVNSQLTGSKRTVPIATETMADSSTSPKRYRFDEDSESSVDVSEEKDLTVGDNQRLRQASKAGIISSGQSTSPLPVSLQSTSVASGFIKPHEVQTNSPNSSLPNAQTTVHTEPVKVQFSHDSCRDHVQTGDLTASNPTISSNTKTNLSNHSTNPGVENESMSRSIASLNITPPLPFISKPVFFSCPGNIFILMDKPAMLPQTVLQTPLPGSVFPVEQNIITLLPAPLTYTHPTSLTSSAEIGLAQPVMSSNCATSLSLQSMIPQNQTTLSHFTSGPANPVSVLLNPGIVVKREPGNNTLLSLGQSSPVQYLLHSQDHRNVTRQQVHQSPEMFSHFQNISGQILENIHGNNSQNVHQESPEIHEQNPAKDILQKNTPTTAENIPNVTQVSAGFTISDLENGADKGKQPGNSLLEHRQPENKTLEHNLRVNEITGYRLSPNYKIHEKRQMEHNALEHKLPDYRLAELASHKEVEEVSTIAQTFQLTDTLNDKSVAETGNLCEVYPQDSENSPGYLRRVPEDDSCILVYGGSRMAASGNKAPTSFKETDHSMWSRNESFNIINPVPVALKNAAANEPTRVQHSTSHIDIHLPGSPNETVVSYNPASIISKTVSQVLPSSYSDGREIFSHLQEPTHVLDLSCKVRDTSSCRNERLDVDINNNSTGDSDLYSSCHHDLSKPTQCVRMFNTTNQANADCISSSVVTPTLLVQTYTHKNALNTSLFSRTFLGLDQSSVWRPWGSNPELKELN